MITNEELLRKMMRYNRVLHKEGHKAAVERNPEEELKGPFGMMQRAMETAFEKGELPPPPPPPPFHFGEMHRRGMQRERLLLFIDDHPEGVWQKDLAEEAHINPSSASELIGKLEKDGFLIRAIDEADKRAVLLTLTEKGKLRAQEIRAGRKAFADQTFSNLTEEEKQTLSNILDKLMA